MHHIVIQVFKEASLIYCSMKQSSNLPTEICGYETLASRQIVKVFQSHPNVTPTNIQKDLVEDNSRLDGTLVAHGLQALFPLVNLVDLVDDALDFDLAGVQVVDSGRELVSLRERTDNGNLVAEDLGRRPGDASCVRVHTINNKLTTTTAVVDGVLEDANAAGSLDDNVETVGVVSLQLSILRRRILAGQLDVLITGTQLLGNLHLQTNRGSNDNTAATVLAQHLGQHETSGTGTEDQSRGTHLGSNLIQAVGGAGGGLEEGGINIGQILDLENTAGGGIHIFAKSSGHGHTTGLEVLAEKLITAAAIEASAAELRVIGNDTISELEALDLRAEGSHNTDDLVAGDERELGNELAVVNVKVGTANTACLDLDL